MEIFYPYLIKPIHTIVANFVQFILASRNEVFSFRFLRASGLSTPIIVIPYAPFPPTNKNSIHHFTVVDSFTKFLLIYPVKSTCTCDNLENIKLQSAISIQSANPRKILRLHSLHYMAFENFCEQENIEHVTITLVDRAK